MARVVILPRNPDDTVTLRPGVDFRDGISPWQYLALKGVTHFLPRTNRPAFWGSTHKKPPPSVGAEKGLKIDLRRSRGL